MKVSFRNLIFSEMQNLSCSQAFLDPAKTKCLRAHTLAHTRTRARDYLIENEIYFTFVNWMAPLKDGVASLREP